VRTIRRRRLGSLRATPPPECFTAQGAVIRTKAFFTLLLAAAGVHAQVMAPEEIRDPQLRALQQKYRNDLKLIAHAIDARNLPFHFYFSRQMDLEETVQKRSDQRSIQFDRYQGRLVLKITGNYFASYSDELIKPEERARLTYETIMLPLLEAAVHALDKADVPQAFAFEISHHVRKKILGVSSEGAENVVLVLPKESAQRLVASGNPQAREAALFEGEAFLNARPIPLWHQEETVAQAAANAPRTPALAQAPPPTAPPEPTVSARVMNGFEFPMVASNFVAGPAAKLPNPSALPAKSDASEPPARVAEPHGNSPAAIRDANLPAPSEPPAKPPEPRENASLKDIQQAHQPVLDQLVKELEPQAHFVSYAPPAFIPFRNAPYLQLSVTTALPPAAAGSQYRLAALAFDRHVAHLIRPVLTYFKDRSDFDGIDFSTTVKVAPGSDEAGSLAVEFIFPMKLLVSYADFDYTGQQLLDAGFVLINGERVGLNLQTAEAGSAAQ